MLKGCLFIYSHFIQRVSYFYTLLVLTIYNMSGRVVSACIQNRAEGESCISDTTRTRILH